MTPEAARSFVERMSLPEAEFPHIPPSPAPAGTHAYIIGAIKEILPSLQTKHFPKLLKAFCADSWERLNLDGFSFPRPDGFWFAICHEADIQKVVVCVEAAHTHPMTRGQMERYADLAWALDDEEIGLLVAEYDWTGVPRIHQPLIFTI